MSGIYIPFDEFKKLYSLDDVIYDKRGNRIFDEGKYIVKEMSLFAVFIRELSFYKYISHPCIMKIIHYTYHANSDGNKFYYSTLKGKNILDAYEIGDISMNEIASDLVSAVKFLHKHGIGHFDIKVDNVIYLNGKATLIDFELADKCQLYETIINDKTKTDYYCKDSIGFTKEYRDPEFSFNYYYNTIRSDYYALAMILYDIYINISVNAREDLYYPSLSIIQDENLRDFISLCIKDWKHRDEITDHPYIIRDYNGSVNDIEYGKLNYDFNNESVSLYARIIRLSINMLYDFDTLPVPAQCVFQIIHLIRYMMKYIFDDYTDKRNMVKLPLVVISCFHLLLNFYSFNIPTHVYKPVSGIKYTNEEILDMSFKILSYIDGNLLFDTYFDVARNYDELIMLFNETLKLDYNTIEMPNIKIDDRKSKFIDLSELLDKWMLEYKIDDTDDIVDLYKYRNQDLRLPLYKPVKFKIHKLKLPEITYDMLETDVDRIILNEDFDSYGVVVNAKDNLHKLPKQKIKDFMYSMYKNPKRRQILKYLIL